MYTAVRRGVGQASLIAFVAMLLFFGITRLPWPALLAMAIVLGWQLGGPRLAFGTALGLGFLIITRVRPQTMLSVYLCGLAVLLSFAIGVALGTLASKYNGVSAFLLPINDTLQTMPLFVILVPYVMILKIGESTTLPAIMACAVVPAIRYAEHALRGMLVRVVEAGPCFGCTRTQLLWRMKLRFAMLVIAALVGTNGLGDGDLGVGVVAGIGMAFIALVGDRMTQGVSRAWQERLGLDSR